MQAFNLGCGRHMLAALAAAAFTASCGGGDDLISAVPPTNPTLQATVPVTPDVPNLNSTVMDGVRVFQLTAHVFVQQIETFPYNKAQVWGYNGSTPGLTAIAYEGDKLRFVVKNDLPAGTTIHFHGAHAPNEDDGVAGVSPPVPIP